MYNPQTKKMKNLISKTTSIISSITVGLLNINPLLADTQYGSNFTRPESLVVTFYQLGLTNSDFTNVFEILNNSQGVEVDIADENAVSNMVTGIKAEPGDYTHTYAVIGANYKLKASSNGCYTKSGTYSKADANYNYAKITIDDVELNCVDCANDAWSAATSNSSEYGTAILKEQAWAVDANGEPQGTGSQGYGPAEPSTSFSVGGVEVNSMQVYLTNSSAPYTVVDEGTALTDYPASSTRDRALYFGELGSTISVAEGSKGTVQIYFDFSKGIGFDDDCDSISFNSNDYDMSVITE